ncbi:MAG: hypothetical protein KDB02_11760, partial [Acidimicrobiales bacterium]|nr:hypothetical protein [Acidimicrobiales bacterium]
QLMDLGWKVLIPLGVGWMLLLVAIRVGADVGWNPIVVVVVATVVMAACYGLLKAAMAMSRRTSLSALEGPEGVID